VHRVLIGVPCLSVPVDSGQPRARWHPRSGNHQHRSALLCDQLAQIVEQVIDVRIAQVGELDPTCRAIEPACDLAIGIDEQSLDPTGGGGLCDLRQVVTSNALGAGLLELFT
jgi:hypothetical protein